MQWEDHEVFTITMDTPLISVDGVGPMTVGVFERAGFKKVGDVYNRSQQEIDVRRAAEAIAVEDGTAHHGHWRARAQRCITIIKRIRNPQFSEIVPEPFLCPITCEAFEDPVITPYGTTYERDAIEAVLQHDNRDPITRQPLAIDKLVPNRALKEALDYYNERLRRFSIPYRVRA